MPLRHLIPCAILFALSGRCCFSSENEGLAILREANHLSDLFNWADARPLYAQAEKLFQDAGDNRDALYARFGRIRGEMETLNLPETSDYLGSQLQSPLLRTDLQLRLMCLIVKGDIDGEIDSAPATADWGEALSVARRLGDRKWESRASAELGFEEFVAGDIGAAMKAVGTGLITARETGDVGAEIRYLGAIGTGLALRKLDGQAISYLDKAIGLARTHPDSGFPFVAVAGKIQALINEHEYNEALTLIEEAAREARNKHKEIKLAQVQLLKADIEIARQQPTAIPLLTDTAGLTREGHSRLFAEAEMKLADAYREKHDLQKAKEAAATAVAATGGSSDMYLAPGRLRTLAEIEVALGHRNQAADLYQRASDIIEGMMSTAPDGGARAALLAEMSPIFSDYFSLEAEQNNLAGAFHIIEQVRGRVIAESLLQPNLHEGNDTQMEDRIRRLKTELVRTPSARRRRALVDELFFAEQARWTSISTDGAVRVPDPASRITLKDVQRQLRVQEVVLEYVLGETESFCLAIDPLGAKVVRLPGRKEIEAIAARYLIAIKAKKESSDDGRSLFAALLEPLRLSAAQTTLLIVPDGILHLVPFSALRDRSGKYVIATNTIWYLPSGGAIALLHRSQSPGASRMFLGVGGVKYGETPTAPSMMVQANPGLLRGGYYGVDVNKLPDLPSTAEEIRSARDILGGSKSALETGAEGTETEFKSTPLGQFRIIHLAIHGKANPKNPDRAALIFRPDPPHDDGLLEPQEILGFHLNADLVVLSACDTAVGHLQGEEGIENLSRTFLTAGARSVVSTLWEIDDTYSLFLMKRFYTHLRDGATEAAALARSQNDVLNKFGEDTPAADWAAFTLLGDGDRVIFPKEQPEVSSR